MQRGAEIFGDTPLNVAAYELRKRIERKIKFTNTCIYCKWFVIIALFIIMVRDDLVHQSYTRSIRFVPTLVGMNISLCLYIFMIQRVITQSECNSLIASLSIKPLSYLTDRGYMVILTQTLDFYAEEIIHRDKDKRIVVLVDKSFNTWSWSVLDTIISPKVWYCNMRTFFSTSNVFLALYGIITKIKILASNMSVG